VTLQRNVSIGHLVMLHGCTIGENRWSASARSSSQP
jgi:carbonic anhydrase/acetyltransferase-like protein (isoleucine patch superfamily)